MVFITAFRRGVRLALQTKRMIVLAWIGSVLVGLPLAFSLLREVQTSAGDTAVEELLVERMDANAILTMKMDRSGSEVLRSLDYTVLGWAPFLDVSQQYLRGSMVKAVTGFFYDLLFRWQLHPEVLGLLGGVSVLYVLLSTFFAGGFLGLYGREPDGDTSRFLRYGAKYFGRFFRLSLLALILYALLFVFLWDPLRGGIARWTAQEPSEMTPFVYYMSLNVAVALVLALLTMSFDYAKIRIVIEERSSAVTAAGAGFGFAFRHLARTGPLYLTLVLIALMLMILYGLLESLLPQSDYGSILAAAVLAQVYMLARSGLRAVWYASGTELFTMLAPASTPLVLTPGAVQR